MLANCACVIWYDYPSLMEGEGYGMLLLLCDLLKKIPPEGSGWILCVWLDLGYVIHPLLQGIATPGHVGPSYSWSFLTYLFQCAGICVSRKVRLSEAIYNIENSLYFHLLFKLLPLLSNTYCCVLHWQASFLGINARNGDDARNYIDWRFIQM